MILPSVRCRPACKRKFLLANGEVARVDDLGGDIDAVLNLKRDQVRLAVLDLIESRLLPRATPDVGENVVVVDRGDKERLTAGLRLEQVVELEFCGIARAELVEPFRGLRLCGAELRGSLGAERFEFLFVNLNLRGTDVAAEFAVEGNTGAFLWLDEDLQIGLGVWLVADFCEEEGVDVAACGNEVQVAADAGLRGMHVAEVVGTIDDPELLVAGR